MASKRKLKKAFGELSLTIYNEAIFAKTITKDKEKISRINDILDDIVVWTDDTFRRISHTDGAKNPQIVRKYYKDLKEEISNKVDIFLDKIFE